jgi:dTDP-4-dehydrorhamnose reductase
VARRALVLGGTGMLGRAVASYWRLRGVPVLALSHAQGDLLDRERLLYWARRFQPEVLINCAAFTQVDACEEREAHATAINGDAVGHVAAAAAAARAQLIQVSSDYVFDGMATGPLREDAPVAPLSAYGRSKLRGEELAAQYERSLIVRVGWLFGPGGPNFVATIRRFLLEGRTPLRVVDDQHGRPTYTPFMARALYDLAARDTRGIVHYGNREPASWYDLAREIVRHVAPTAEVIPVATTEFPRPARRPVYSVLDVSLFEKIAGRPVESWTAGLASYLDAFPLRP